MAIYVPTLFLHFLSDRHGEFTGNVGVPGKIYVNVKQQVRSVRHVLHRQKRTL